MTPAGSKAMHGILAAALFLLSSAAPAQEITGSQRTALLTAARSQYYNLRVAGVQSFSCNVDVDWLGLFTSVSGKAPDASNPVYASLRNLRIGVKEALPGGAEVSFAATGTPPDSAAAAVSSMRAGIQQMLSGFFQSWTPFLSGDAISMKPRSLTSIPAGYLLDDSQSDNPDQLTFDKQMVLTRIDTRTAAISGVLASKFDKSPDGLLLTDLEGDIHQPSDGPATHVVMHTDYQMVDSFRVPHNLSLGVKNVATFKMALTGCTVQKQANQ
jgi:hypothetical protein